MRRVFPLVMCLALVAAFPVALADDYEMEFEAELTGAEEVPELVETEAVGEAEFEVDEHLASIEFELEVEGGRSMLAVAGAHIHCAFRGENGPVVATLAGVVPGGLGGGFEVEATLTDANISDVGCGANVAELVEAMREGRTYVNVHSGDFPGGEIRGQILLDDEDDDHDEDDDEDEEDAELERNRALRSGELNRIHRR